MGECCWVPYLPSWFELTYPPRLFQWLHGKEFSCNAEDTGDTSLIPGSGGFPGGGNGNPIQYSWVSLVVQLVKNPCTMWETWVWSLGWEDPLKKGTVTLSSILTWRIPWTVSYMGSQREGYNWVTFSSSILTGKIPRTEEPGGLQSQDSKEGTTEWLNSNNKASRHRTRTGLITGFSCRVLQVALTTSKQERALGVLQGCTCTYTHCLQGMQDPRTEWEKKIAPRNKMTYGQ